MQLGAFRGNTLMRRYLESNQWITNPTNEEQIKKFNELANFFKTYASQYGFDYLMVIAQGYQESMLNQAARSPGGAVVGSGVGKATDVGSAAEVTSQALDHVVTKAFADIKKAAVPVS